MQEKKKKKEVPASILLLMYQGVKMCFKALGVMLYLVGIDSQKRKSSRERQRKESEEGVKLN